MALGICTGCRRFARGEKCPFCGAAVGEGKSLPRGRATRAGVVVAAATAAVVATACSSAYGGPPGDGGSNDTGADTMVAAYGGPPMDAGGN
jgi:hypothetical protein